jgi:putative nucleotidyltransferase with HDIG domain
MKILVVDDNAIVLNLVTDLLKEEGYCVDSVNNAFDAIKKLELEKYDILVTDIKMPRMSGMDIIKKLQQISPETKAIIMTGFGDLETAQTAIREGAYDYLFKPFDNDALRQAVKKAIERKKSEKESVRLKELISLSRVSELISSNFSTKKLFELILESIIKQLKAEQGSIMILDPETQVLSIAASVGLDEEIVKNTKIKIGEGISGKVAMDGKPVLVTNIDEHPLFSELSHGYPDKSFISYSFGLDEEIISYPMVSSSKIFGVINLRKKIDNTPFTKSDLELISILSTQAAIAVENSRLFVNLNNIYIEIMQFIVALTEARDVYLQGHTQRVTQWCIKLGKALGLNAKEMEIIRYAAILHDIGKLAISETILNKPGKLTNEEYEIIKTHPVIGANIIKPLHFLDSARNLILHHHERLDGKGYPDGLSGREVTLSMNIIILADSYDAMNSSRAYRHALTNETINEEISRNINKQFHPTVSEAFFKLLKE